MLCNVYSSFSSNIFSCKQAFHVTPQFSVLKKISFEIELILYLVRHEVEAQWT